MGALRKCLLLFVCWCVVAGEFAVASGLDARGQLDQLSSGSAAEREAAQRWLGLHLTEADYPALAAGVRLGDAEAGRRLAMALASESRHLGLVLLLTEEESKELASIGRDAFEELLARWCPEAGQRPSSYQAIERGLEDQMAQALVSAGASETLELHVDRLDRHAQFGVPLVVEPGVASRLIDTAQMQGNGLALLRELTEKERLTFAGIGEWTEEAPGPGAWILVADMGGARSRSGAQRLLAWFHTVQRETAGAAPAARALARCGWPAALDWLDRRWAQRRDKNALQGLLAAASHGRASRQMLRSETRKELLAMGDGALALSNTAAADVLQAKASRRQAEEIARALIGAGGLGLDGEELSAHWMGNWSRLNDAQRWLRFALLEGQRSGGSAARAFLVAQVQEAGELSDATRFQALRALAAMPAREDEVLQLGDVKSMVSWALMHGLGPELTRLMHSMGVPVRELELPRDWSSRMFRLGLACAQWDHEVAVGECLQIALGAPEPTLQALEEQLEELRFRSGPKWMEGVARAALKGARTWSSPKLARLELVFLNSGVLVLPVNNEVWLRSADARTTSVVDFDRLGAWAGTPAGSLETQFLIKAVRTPPTGARERAALVNALSRALRRLHELHEDELAERLKESVWQASAVPDSPLNTALNPSNWPSAEPSLTIDLIALERLAP